MVSKDTALILLYVSGVVVMLSEENYVKVISFVVMAVWGLAYLVLSDETRKVKK